MPIKWERVIGFFGAVAFAMLVSATANALPNPIARVGTTSKSVIQKLGDGAKDVAIVPARVARVAGVGAKDLAIDVAVGAKDIGSSVVNHVRRI